METRPIVLDEAPRAWLEQRFGASAAAWCDGLGALVANVAAGWGLWPVELFPPGATSVVLGCEGGDGGRAVLKLTPDPRIAAEEAAALRTWAGSPRVVALLDADVERGALLLEWLPDTRPLSDLDWSLGEVLPVLADLRRPRPAQTPGPAGPGGLSALAGLPSLAERVELIFELAERRARRLRPWDGAPQAFARGLAAARALAGSGPADLVHGDLHPGNVLRVGAGRGLVAIDPRPCVGDQGFDLVDWVLMGARKEAQVRRRVAELSQGLPGVDASRLQAWCEAVAVVLAVKATASSPDDPRVRFLLCLGGQA